ncbi:MAG: hypothetical protein LUE89_11240 [Clostridiales bacterium]|nr:hypothetical protein [Clostridiales bacterium]
MAIRDRNGQQRRVDMLKCNNCGKQFAIRGVKIRTEQWGEWTVSYFACPHCGKQYNVGTTDEAQRELLRQIREANHKIKVGKEKHFTAKTLKKYAEARNAAQELAKNRNKWMEDVGNRLLAGEPLEEVLAGAGMEGPQDEQR